MLHHWRWFVRITLLYRQHPIAELTALVMVGWFQYLPKLDLVCKCKSLVWCRNYCRKRGLAWCNLSKSWKRLAILVSSNYSQISRQSGANLLQTQWCHWCRSTYNGKFISYIENKDKLFPHIQSFLSYTLILCIQFTVAYTENLFKTVPAFMKLQLYFL